MKFALIDNASGRVKQWQDDTLHGYADPTTDETRVQLPDDFTPPDAPSWHVADSEFTTTPPAPPPVAPGVLAEAARAQRDALLTACDWVTLRSYDQGKTTPTAWDAYRQALRDVPAQAGFPNTINWPQAPAS